MTREYTDREDYTIGVISDTHGSLLPQVSTVFQHVDVIIHAGDIGGLSVLDALGAIAPVIAVRGNMDSGSWAYTLPETEVAGIGSRLVYLLHDLARIDLKPSASGFHAVIHGHTHRPFINKQKDVLYINPGTAGSGSSRPTAAIMEIKGESLDAEVVKLV